jgi:hypothetical protein
MTLFHKKAIRVFTNNWLSEASWSGSDAIKFDLIFMVMREAATGTIQKVRWSNLLCEGPAVKASRLKDYLISVKIAAPPEGGWPESTSLKRLNT